MHDARRKRHNRSRIVYRIAREIYSTILQSGDSLESSGSTAKVPGREKCKPSERSHPPV